MAYYGNPFHQQYQPVYEAQERAMRTVRVMPGRIEADLAFCSTDLAPLHTMWTEERQSEWEAKRKAWQG